MRIINICKDFILTSALKVKEIIITFNPDNIKISKKLISSYSITLFFMIVIGAICMLSVEKAKTVSAFQAKIENVLLNLRTADQHMFAYYADRKDYRPEIILRTTKISADSLKSVLNDVPSSLKQTYDSAYIEIASIQEIGQDYFKSAALCDSCISVSNQLIDSLHVEISKESSISRKDLSIIYKNLQNISLYYNTHNHQLGLLKWYNSIFNGIKANGKILNKYKNTTTNLIKINNHLYENSNLFKTLNEENRVLAYKMRRISYYTAISIRNALDKTTVIFKEELYRNVVLVVGTIIFAILLLVVIAFFLIRSIARGLESVNDAAKKIADGDLTIKFSNKALRRKDEIGSVNKSFSAMIESLSRIIKNIELSSTSLDDSAKELNSGSQNLSEDANSQAVSIEEISATVEDITHEIDLNAQNSNKTSSLSQISVKHIEKIEKQTTEQVTKSIEILNKSKYVSSIAMQTNILAINAAIEASKAGMAGKGFSVIANEVKKLAENSKNAAVEITGITKIGAKLSKDGGEMLQEILPNIKNVNTLIQEIAKVSNSQRTKSENIKDALISLSNISQNNVAQSEELTSQSEELKEQAIMLKKQISFFKIAK